MALTTEESERILREQRETNRVALLRSAEELGPEITRALEARNRAKRTEINPPLPDEASGGEGKPAFVVPPRNPLDWADLATKTPPAREWIIDHWIPRGDVTLLAGPGGTGKSALAQAMGACVATQREFLDDVPVPRKVLMWAAEDTKEELWRRQLDICRWLGISLSELAGLFILESYHHEQIDLCAMEFNRLTHTPMLGELRDQIGDYQADFVILDNVARLFGGNENDRNSVTKFVAWLNWACTPTRAGLLLLGHPAKQADSEYSGSTAWEGAVRARLYFGRNLPGTKGEEGDDETLDDNMRYLSRRKANYSGLDWRRVAFNEGVMKPEPYNPERPNGSGHVSGEVAFTVVLQALRSLTAMSQHATASTASRNYLPKLARKYELLGRLSEGQFAAAMRQLQKDGRLKSGVVGQYPNRTAKEGLIEA